MQLRRRTVNYSIVINVDHSLDAEQRAQLAEDRRKPQRRAKRPGQLPPAHNAKRGRSTALYSDSVSGYDADCEDSGLDELAPTPAHATAFKVTTASISHKERVHRAHNSWNVRRSYNRDCLRLSAASSFAAAQHRQEQQREAFEALIAEVKGDHGCIYLLKTCKPSSGFAAEIQEVSSREVFYHTLGCSVSVQVPTVRCSACKDTYEIPPSLCRCFGSSPVQPLDWYDTSVLDMYSSLAYTDGTSATVFCQALDSVCDKAGVPHTHDTG